jgi:hypothetical protein
VTHADAALHCQRGHKIQVKCPGSQAPPIRLRVSIQDQAPIGHPTALTAQKHIFLRKNVPITTPMRKSM